MPCSVSAIRRFQLPGFLVPLPLSPGGEIQHHPFNTCPALCEGISLSQKAEQWQFPLKEREKKMVGRGVKLISGHIPQEHRSPHTTRTGVHSPKKELPAFVGAPRSTKDGGAHTKKRNVGRTLFNLDHFPWEHRSPQEQGRGCTHQKSFHRSWEHRGQQRTGVHTPKKVGRTLFTLFTLYHFPWEHRGQQPGTRVHTPTIGPPSFVGAPRSTRDGGAHTKKNRAHIIYTLSFSVGAPRSTTRDEGAHTKK